MTGVFHNPLSLLAGWLLQMALQAAEGNREAEHAGGAIDDGDHLLMARLQGGDRQAFDLLFEKWKRPLISFFYRSTGDYHAAEDLTLEVAMRVYQARDRYVARAKFSTWLFQIARNRLRDAWRRKGPTLGQAADGFSPEWDYPETTDTADPHEQRLWEEWLMEALKSAPESERTALLLVAQQGMTPSEAAETMNLTPNHLRVLLNKARNRLKTFRKEER
jgi:RNA polymerase sigma-70 factor (ECF subfamily)